MSCKPAPKPYIDDAALAAAREAMRLGASLRAAAERIGVDHRWLDKSLWRKLGSGE